MDEVQRQDPPTADADADADVAGGRRSWARVGRSRLVGLGLVVLPVLAAIAGYYRQVGTEDWAWQLHGDQVFYGYQMTRVAEAGGRWWEVADDRRLGWPYQSIAAKHSGLFEGLDLLLISTLSARVLDPPHNYHFLVLAVLAFNGWVAAWLVRRATGSAAWAALAVLLITWNEPTSLRMTGHLHLFKYGWLLLAVWAFSRYLDAPSTRRGVALGLAAAGVLQGSFYFGFFLALTLGAAWLGSLVAGKLGRRHAVATVAAAATFVAAAALATFPVWAITKGYPLADQFARHPWKHTWYFSSEPWQWLVSRGSPAATRYIEEVGAKDPALYFEGWSFPGYAVLAGIAAYAAGRLRGLRPCDRDEGRRFLDVAMGQLALLVGLSVTGGPSYFFFRIVPSIRCYGRSSLMGLVGLGCVAAPICLHAMTRRCRFRLTRAGIMAASVALVAYDFANLQHVFAWTPKAPDTTPAWVDWLAGQPPRVKLAAFGPTGQDYWYGTLAYAVRHGHTALNGCDYDLLNGDLALLGASYSRMNPEGLRFVASLGFETLAVHRDYLEAHPWIGSLPWLGRREEVGDWRIFATNARFAPIPAVSPAELLARQGDGKDAAEVPPQCWITGQLDLDRTVVVGGPMRAYLAWADASGKLLGEPRLALYQHVFGPDLPAYTIKTPVKAGAYRLVFLDERRRRLGSRPFVVSPGVFTGRLASRGRPPGFAVSPLIVRAEECRGDRARITLENRTGCYIQAHSSREPAIGSAGAHPGITPPAPGSLVLELNYQEDEGRSELVSLVLPRDLPPHGRLAMDLPIRWRRVPGSAEQVFVLPKVVEVGEKAARQHLGEVAVRLDPDPDRIATTPAPPGGPDDARRRERR